MASAARGIWAIDIGNNSLKALHLRSTGEKLEVIGFDYLEHAKILSSGNISDAEKTELIAASLRQFVEQNGIIKDDVFISVAGQTSFARFIKLPPVEPKRIPEIVKFEAVQQIPFDINEVEWDWQVMQKPDSPDVEVGIFAIKNEVIGAILDNFTRENLRVTGVQMAPIALYNYATYERGVIAEGDKNAVIVMDMGAENTDLVICTKSGVWQRSVPLGGNAFTRAVAEAFKLDFEKAEKLKRTAPMSKYARQIFQSMKPVFSDLAAEIQRSLGFYSTTNREIKFQKVIALGGGMKMQGLIKFLQQTIQLPIVRPDTFDQIDVASGVSAAKFHDNVADFGVVYGLAVQGLELAKIESNLLPRKIARTMRWTRKSNYFTIAASVLMAISLLALGRTMMDRSSYIEKGKLRDETQSIVNRAQKAGSQLKQEESKSETYDSQIQKQIDFFKYRDVIPLVYQTILKSLPGPDNNPADAELYKAFTEGNVIALKKIPRIERKQLFITRFDISYVEDLGSDSSDDSTAARTNALASGSIPQAGGFSRAGKGSSKSSYSRPSVPKVAESAGNEGFVIDIEGFSPYKNINDLLDPAGVGNEKNKWGMVTRLENLDPNGAFKLFNKTDRKNFSIDFDVVDMANVKAMPAGIGVEKEINAGSSAGVRAGTGSKMIIDPMTEEVMSKEPEYDSNGKAKMDRAGKPLYRINDYWFRMHFKLAWNKDLQNKK